MNLKFLKLISDLQMLISDFQNRLIGEKGFVKESDKLICELYWHFRGSNKEEEIEIERDGKDELDLEELERDKFEADCTEKAKENFYSDSRGV